MRAWYWLEDVRLIAGVANAKDLDKTSLVSGLPLRPHFSPIAEDGFDPDRSEAKAKRSLLTHVANNKAFKKTVLTYRHPFWAALRNRAIPPECDRRWIDERLAKLGLALIEATDGERVNFLGLDWPLFPSGARPVVQSLIELAGASSEVALDDLHALLILYRYLQDKGALGLAEEVRGLLRYKLILAGLPFKGEAADTWRVITHSRALAWIPELEPSPTALARAEQIVIDAFNNDPKPRARPRRSPESFAEGQAGRRWRRRIYIKAASIELGDEVALAGFQALTPFNHWLIENRQPIDARNMHVLRTTADQFRPGGPRHRPSVFAALTVPRNKTHREKEDQHSDKPKQIHPRDRLRFGPLSFVEIDDNSTPIEPVLIPDDLTADSG